MPQNHLHRTWCDISLDHFRHNIEVIRTQTDKQLIAVLKADAYGHGMAKLCPALIQAGITLAAVATLSEGCALREAGFVGDILILGYSPPASVPLLVAKQLSQTVYDAAYATLLRQVLAEQPNGTRLPVHLKVDTGMYRLGFLHHEQHQADAFAAIQDLVEDPSFDVRGIFTHFAHADSTEPHARSYTALQHQRFCRLVVRLESAGICFPLVHAENSGAISTLLQDDAIPSVCNAVRVGILLYGCAAGESLIGALPLRPVMTLKTVISMIKRVPSGVHIGYGGGRITTRETLLATVPVGYADGYPRALSHAGVMLVRGIRCPIMGRICMDQTLLDLTDLPDAVASDLAIGEVVTVFGVDTETGASILPEQLAPVIDYEIFCGISRRVPRYYLQGGTVVAVTDPLVVEP